MKFFILVLNAVSSYRKIVTMAEIVCKNCYNPKKKVNSSGIWHCKYCGETNENKRFRNYLFCKGCAKTRYLPKGITEWKCKDCGTTDVTQRVDIQMLCKCYNLRANNKGIKQRSLLLKHRN